MATFFITIVPTLILKDGKHKIRIAMTHNGQTRYIATNITIDSIKEFKSGRIVKRNDKDILNLQLKKICNQYEEKYAKIENADFLSCTQVYKLLIGPVIEQKCRSFENIVSEYLSQIDIEDRGKTYKLYRLAANRFIQFAGKNSLMEHITPIRINSYINALKKQKLSSTTINIYITL